jgi:hypothetical protein
MPHPAQPPGLHPGYALLKQGKGKQELPVVQVLFID